MCVVKCVKCRKMSVMLWKVRYACRILFVSFSSRFEPMHCVTTNIDFLHVLNSSRTSECECVGFNVVVKQVVPYSIMSVGHRADLGFLAVNLQVT